MRRVTNVEFEAGYVYLTYDDGARAKCPISDFLAGSIDSGDYVDASITQAKLESAKLAYIGIYGVGQYGVCLYGT